MVKGIKVYVAGKLSSDAVNYLNNVHRMMTTAEAARLAGFSVFVPALDMLMGIKFGYTDYHDYFDNSQPWLKSANAILLVDNWRESPGTLREMVTAIWLNIPVFESVESMSTYFNAYSGDEDVIKAVSPIKHNEHYVEFFQWYIKTKLRGESNKELAEDFVDKLGFVYPELFEREITYYER